MFTTSLESSVNSMTARYSKAFSAFLKESSTRENVVSVCLLPFFHSTIKKIRRRLLNQAMFPFQIYMFRIIQIWFTQVQVVDRINPACLEALYLHLVHVHSLDYTQVDQEYIYSMVQNPYYTSNLTKYYYCVNNTLQKCTGAEFLLESF